MTDIHTLLTQAIQDFGDTPGATLEQDLIDQHQEHPAAVELAITKITRAHAQGKINSPWGAIRAEVTKQIKARTTIPQATHAKRNAEQWMRTCGLHYDRWTEIEAELQRHHWPTDLQLLWTELRPAGEQLEADELARAEHWQRTRPEVKARLLNPQSFAEGLNA